MKEIQKTFYCCDYCNLEFSDKNKCSMHETKTHKCPNCKHNFYLFGVEQVCDLKNSQCCYTPIK